MEEASCKAAPVSMGSSSHTKATMSEIGWESVKEETVFSSASKQADFSHGSSVMGSILRTFTGTKSFPMFATL